MPLSAKAIRTQLALLQPLLEGCSLETMRLGQNKLGEMMEAKYKNQVLAKVHDFECCDGAWMLPRDERRQGVVLYLHGGGYTCGSLEYAKGFGSMLAVQCGVRVFCLGYRLAPENPYPAALEDAVTAYQYLLEKGYRGDQIALCGESAGGGLCYALCMKLQELELPQPCGIIAISPWTDLTASGSSYEENRERDPSMTRKRLEDFANHYTQNREDPLVSPLFGDLAGMPPSLLFVGGDEIMRSDAEDLHEKLLSLGCESKLLIAPERWHGYLLYGLGEDRGDFATMNAFLNRILSPEHKLRWMPLDNAAKIYPAAARKTWSNMFRLSATLTENVDVAVLQSALDVTVRRFPSIATRLRKGVFWYYLQQLSRAPQIREENSYPLTRMSRSEMRQCAFRVIVYKKRIAVEFFHSLTDGTGGMIFLKTLLAEYLQQRYGVSIPAKNGVLGRLEEPKPEELEDSFQNFAATVSASRKEADAYHLSGTPEAENFVHLTCLQAPVKQMLEKAHQYHVSLTVFLAAAMTQALLELQREEISDPQRRKPVKVQLPVNLRSLHPSKTLRNFALYTTPEVDPRLGEYTFGEICKLIHHHMGLDVTAKRMSAKVAANVSSERILALKLTPLFVKNVVMRAVFDSVGERKSCLSLSNLGRVELPEEMLPYVERMDFILSVQATQPHNCGVLSFGDTLYINFVRNIREPKLEYRFYQVLRDMGIPVQVESNLPE